MSAASAEGRPATRRWTLVGTAGATDVEVTASDGTALSAVVESLAGAAGTGLPPVWSGSTRLEAGTDLRSAALAHGAVLGIGRPGPRPLGPAPRSALALDFVGGPEAGRSLPLDGGRHVLGRGSSADVPVDDADVSRRHAVVEVAAGRVSVRDAGSANGSVLDDAALGAEPVEWSEGSVLRIGSSAVTVRGPRGTRLAAQQVPGGRTLIHPVAEVRPARREVEVRFPAAPAELPRRRLALVAVAVPAVAGALAAWVFSAPTFLFFALLSPVVALGTWLGDRWTGRRTRRRDTAAHAEQTAVARSRLVEAVRADQRASDLAAPDLARLTAAARRRAAPLWERRRDDPGALVVRLGRGPGTTRVVQVEADGARTCAPCADLPVVVDLALTGGLAVAAPRPRAVRVVNSLLAQACVLLPPGELGVALLTTPDRLADWRWLRWLPHVGASDVRVTPAADVPEERTDAAWLDTVVARRTRTPGGRPAADPWLLVVVDRPVGRRLAATLRAAREGGVLTLVAGGSTPLEAGALLRVAGEVGQEAELHLPGAAVQELVVDQLPPEAAAALARDLAPLSTPASGGGGQLRAVRLLELLPVDPLVGSGAAAAGGWSRRRDALVVTLGRSAEGVASVDLCRDGPHALVAGTTGAGKSELLQTLIAGLALAHPPDRCSFLLVDYKGGAAFAEAAGLPHTVGVVTDLDARTTARALHSLGAELTRRETVLAEAGVADVVALPEEVDLARLVIVVDEFAGLAEELPDFVPGLVAIAQRGRSLGVHLVLATQRPAGVVSPEIRANCSLRLCLRTTDESDSRDVIGTGAAAHLPAHRPGRAYLRVGASAPVLLQVARVAGRPVREPDGPRVRRWDWPASGPDQTPEETTGPTDLARLVTALRQRTERSGVRLPHRPWCPPLPDRLTTDELSGATTTVRGPGPALAVGLVDRPEAQRQEVLAVDLAAGGGWLAVGGPASGRTTFLRTVLAEAVTSCTPDELHVHVLDHAGGALARAAADLPHTGTAVAEDDPLRTVRLVSRLAAEVSARRGAGRSTPRLLLLIDGVELLSAQLDEADPAHGSAALLRLVREGGAAGVTSLLTAERAVPGGRIAAAAGTRLVLPLPDRADYGVAGIAARAVPGHRPPGRALVGEAAWECQIALPRPLPATARSDIAGPASTALRIPVLEPDPELPLPQGTGSDLPPMTVPVGPGGDEGGVLDVDLARSGGLLVVGPPGSGRSAVLAAVTAHLVAAGTPVLRIAGSAGRTPDTAAAHRAPGTGTVGRPGAVPAAGAAVAVHPSDLAGWTAWVEGLAGRSAVVVVDDHPTVAETPVVTALTAAHPEGVVLVASGTAAELSSVYRGPVAALRRRRSGLLLCPSPGDADLLGVRLPRTPVPVRPGSGWLVHSGVPQRVQVALRRRSPAPARP